MSVKCANPCKTCEKKGLPILLTRQGIVPEDTLIPKNGGAKVPKLSSSFRLGDIDSIELGAETQYGLRLLRTGYVYVFDEARDAVIDEYFVTNDSFLTKLPERKQSSAGSHKPATDFQCARNGLSPLAGFITIANPDKDRTLWIAFSDAAWTDDIYDNHLDNANLRAGHMQSITLKGGKIARSIHKSKAGIAPIKDVSKHIVEFNKEAVVSGAENWLSTSFGLLNKLIATASIDKWSPFPFNWRENNDTFKAAVKKVDPEDNGAIVALYDPVAITAELVSILRYRVETFMGETERHRGVVLENQLAMLEQSIKHQARMQESAVILAHNDEAKLLKSTGSGKAANPRGQYRYDEISQSEAKRRCELKAKVAWDDYQKKINPDKRQEFNNKLADDMEPFYAKQIDPLVASYDKWLKSASLINTLDYNFDKSNIHSGDAFVSTVTLCALDGQMHPKINTIYAEHLAGDITDRQSYFLKAMVYNQKVCIDMVAKQKGVGLDDLKTLPWDAIIGTMKDALKGVNDVDSHVPYMTAMAGALTRYFSNAVDKVVPKIHGVIASGMAAMHPPIMLEFEGTKRQFRAAAVKWAEREFGVTLAKKDLQRRLNTLEIYGEKLNETGTKRFMLVASPDTLKNMPANLKPSEEIAWVRKHLTTFEAYEEHYINNLAKPRVTPTAVKTTFGTITPYGLSVIAGVLQLMAYKSLLNDEKAKQKDSTQHTWRLAAGGMAIAGAVGETLGAALEQFGPKAGRFKNLASVVSRWSTLIGKALGALAGVITGVWDVWVGWKEGQKGNYALGGATVVLGFAGAGTAVALYAGWIAVLTGFIAVLIIIAVSLAIMFFKDNALQDWLERTLFGVLDGHTYADGKQEQAEFKLAMTEMRG